MAIIKKRLFNSLYTKSSNGNVSKVTYSIVEIGDKVAIHLETETENNTNTKITEVPFMFRKVKLDRANAIVLRNIEIKLRNGYKTLEMLGFDINDKVAFSEIDMLLSTDKTDASGNLKVMKAIQFRLNVLKKLGMMVGQVKINGLRGTLLWEKVVTGIDLFEEQKERAVIKTKEGLYYHFPHITDHLTKDFFMYGDTLIQYDGELYIPNSQLNIINASSPKINYVTEAVTNCKYDSTKVSFWCFDLSIPDVEQFVRFHMMDELLEGFPIGDFEHHENTDSIIRLNWFSVTIDDYEYYLDKAIKSGYEGIIFRDELGTYQFGKRNSIMMKLKKSKTTECRIIDIILKNELEDNGNTRTFISCVLENDINKETFESTPEGDEDYRLELLNNKHKYIGLLATIRFFERSGIKKVPFHSNVILIGRETIGDLDVNDLNIEI